VAKFSKTGVWDKVPEENTLIFAVPKFPYSTVWDRWKEASMPRTSSIRPVVSIQYRLVTGEAELSLGSVDPWVGSGWVKIFQFLVG